MKYIRKSFLCSLLLVLSISFCMTIKATMFSVSGNASQVEPGDSFQVYVSDNVVGYFSVTVSNGTASTGSFYINNIGDGASFTVTAGSAGKTVVTVTGLSISDSEYNTSEGQTAQYSVNVIAPQTNVGGNSGNSGSSSNTQTPTQNETPNTEKPKEEAPKNSDSSLSALSIKEGKLSPDFKAGTISYKVTVAEGTTKVNVSAKANNSKSNVTGDGEISVKAGNNKVKVTCTAEDGSTSVYTIDVYVEEKPVTTMELGGKTLNVFENIQGANLDNKAFTKTTVKISGKDIPAWKSEAQNVTLLYLNGEDGDDFYIYDEAEQKVTSIYRPVGVLGKNLIMINVPDELQTRNGMKFTTVEIDKIKFPGWTFEDKAFENYALIYVMDGQGNYAYYQYDKSEQTLQRFSGAAAITQEKYDAYVKDKKDKEQLLMYIIYGLGAGCVILAGLAGYFFFHKKPKQPKHKKIDIEKEDYEERFHIEKDQ